jgi:diaminohydroxyphosphoribosylaminopyrimidine deaminase/5-amino-6-(5-phosphoribosylamino)uracil reductase
MKIPKVFIGCRDPFEKVNGQGISKLRDNGVEVIVDFLEEQCRELNRRFFTFHEKQRPYIILKYAQTKDGFIGGDRERWISNEYSRKLVHKWRSEEQVIIVGTNTVEVDNPFLTVRDYEGKNPLRVIVGKRKLSENLHVFNDAAKTIRVENPQEALKELYGRNILSVIVEGGSKLLQSFIDVDLWDEARIFIGDKFFGSGIRAPELKKFSVLSRQKVADDDLLIMNK